MLYPRVSIWSQFRNAAGAQIEQYRRQINALDYPPELLRLYLCEGDSNDGTLAELRNWAVDDTRITIIQHDTGIPHHAHSTRPERMKAVSENGNKGWDAIAYDAFVYSLPDGKSPVRIQDQFALMLESDLLCKPDLLRLLIERRPDAADIFSPMVWISVGTRPRLRFYDIWAYRRKGKMFKPTSPEWYFAHLGSAPVEVDSVGSVVLFKMDLIIGRPLDVKGLRLGESDCILGMCNEARSRGYRIFVDPTIDVLHPEIQGIS